MKRLISILLIALMCLPLFAPTVLADEENSYERVVMGVDLNSDQRAQIFADFGINEGSVTELTMTNAEERENFEGLLPDERLGYVSRSCVYIKLLDEGEGLRVSTNNINWCTDEMYMNAMITVGISDAEVKISAPYPMSGTAALCGIYKAYEDITGSQLDDDAKDAGAQELITTGELAEWIGSEDATRLINELKKILSNIASMTDEEVLAEIDAIAARLNIQLTADQKQQILSLCRTLQNLDVDGLQGRLLGWLDTIEQLQDTSNAFAAFWNSVLEFFTKIGDFFKGIFGG
ncbi:MAG: DUF1002 domain-containing protein [Clostridia bacterium]|nr:DUF1002 domain-containing protein [Clostridia bacterium]